MNAITKREAEALDALVTSKGQLTLPVAIRKRLGIQEGSRLTIEVRGDEIVMRPEPSMRLYRGMLRGHAIPASTEPEKEADRHLP